MQALTCLHPATAATQHNKLLMGGRGILVLLRERPDICQTFIRTEPFLPDVREHVPEGKARTVNLCLKAAMCLVNLCVCERERVPIRPTRGRRHWFVDLNAPRAKDTEGDRDWFPRHPRAGHQWCVSASNMASSKRGDSQTSQLNLFPRFLLRGCEYSFGGNSHRPGGCKRSPELSSNFFYCVSCSFTALLDIQ